MWHTFMMALLSCCVHVVVHVAVQMSLVREYISQLFLVETLYVFELCRGPTMWGLRPQDAVLLVPMNVFEQRPGRTIM